MHRFTAFPKFISKTRDPAPLRGLVAATAVAAVFLCCAGPARSQPVGGAEFDLNSFTTGEQGYPRIAAAPNGSFVVVWESDGQDGSGNGVFQRRFNAAGAPLGPETQISNTTLLGQAAASIAMDDSGNYVVVWESDGQDGSNDGVFARRFNAAGSALGAEFQVNSFTTSAQDDPDVAMADNGDFIVVWESVGQDGSSTGVYVQMFNANGTTQGGEFRANTNTISGQLDPAVAADAAGNFVVMWSSTGGQDGNSSGVFAQRFTAAGALAGTEFQANTYTTNNQDEGDCAMDDDGNFVVIWESFGQDFGANGIYAQRYLANGTPAGGEFRANQQAASSQDDAAGAYDGDGNLTIVWESSNQDGSGNSVIARRFDGSGAALDDEFLVNVFTTEDQDDATVWHDGSGDFVVAWQSQLQDGSYGGIFARIFTDGVATTTTLGPTTTTTVGPTTTTTVGPTTTTTSGPTTTTTTGPTTTTTLLPAGCGAAPATGCRLGQPGKSVLTLKLKGGSKDKFKWKLGKGDATAIEDFSDPVNTAAASYRVCVYENGAKRMELDIPPMGTCGSRPCWKASGKKGYAYRDPDLTPSGVSNVTLKSGDAGKTLISVSGKGSALGAPVLPFGFPVVAQLVVEDGQSSTCWQTTFIAAIKNSTDLYRGKGPQ